MSGYDDIADPELLARLSAWFGDGGQMVAEVATPSFTPPPQPDPRIAELEKFVDPWLVDRLEGLVARSDAMLGFSRAPLESILDLSIARFEEPPAPPPDDELEYWQPDDIRAALADDNTPQAVLRDLFRPVMYFGDVVLRPLETGLERLGQDPTAAVRQAVKEPVCPGLTPLPAELIAADIGELRALLASPWEECRPETPSKPSIIPDYEHYQWFGVDGGYDPDV
jgi:hypothetical protein